MKTALVLGGGGSRGSYQLGAWKALRELGICPDVVTGTSVGALNGALIVQNSYDTALELWENLDTTSIFDFPKEPHFSEYAKAFFRQGGVCRNGLKKLINTYLQEEKIRASKVPLGMIVVRRHDLAPRRVFTEDIPQGMLGDYLMATTACFPAAQCHRIFGVEYMDGGYYDNLPIELAKQKGAERIIAVGLEPLGIHSPLRKDASVVPVCPKWSLGNWLVFRKENTGRNIRLGYLDTLKAFGVYEGDAFTFRKNTFRELSRRKQLALFQWRQFFRQAKTLGTPLQQEHIKAFQKLFPEHASTEEILKISAEITGRIWKLSPYVVYNADTFTKALRQKSAHLQNITQHQSVGLLRLASELPEETAARLFLSVFLA